MSDKLKGRKVLLIDGDILLYQIALNNEVDTHWGDGLWTLHCDCLLYTSDAADE